MPEAICMFLFFTELMILCFLDFDFLLDLSTYDHHEPVCAHHLFLSDLQKEQVQTSALCFSYLSPHAALTATAICSQEMTPKWRQPDQAKPNQINQPTNQTDKNYLFLAEKIGAKKFIRPYLSVLVARDI